jgi:16S rRNA C1402 (ribose-2'-O) methylase RsmI
MDLVAHYNTTEPRGEFVLVVAAEATSRAEQDESPEVVVARLLDAGLAPSTAAREAARLTGLPRSTLYELARQRSKREADPRP